MIQSFLFRHTPQAALRCRLYSSQSDPIRVLFCGADDFSIYSLRAVHELQKQRPDVVASIDVVCRPDKRVGRGLKKTQSVPIKSVAEELGLPIHQIDTFTGWSPPASINLVVAVSFGLLVPSRILKSALHGGLNIHPSMLPDFRGPAPIQHALLQARTHTGVTLQTMHPTRFDHGKILDQTPQPGVPISDTSITQDMVNLLGPIGAAMLSNGIANRIWLNKEELHQHDVDQASRNVSHAPKIMPEDKQINWNTWTADQILRHDRVIGPLWDNVTYQRCIGSSSHQDKRVVFHGPWQKFDPSDSTYPAGSPGEPTLVGIANKQPSILALKTCDGMLIGPQSTTIEGEQKAKGAQKLTHALMMKHGNIPSQEQTVKQGLRVK